MISITENLLFEKLIHAVDFQKMKADPKNNIIDKGSTAAIGYGSAKIKNRILGNSSMGVKEAMKRIDDRHNYKFNIPPKTTPQANKRTKSPNILDHTPNKFHIDSIQ